MRRETMATTVSGSIDTDTTWVRAASPYEVTGNIIVQRGVTLAVEAGVEVRFARHVRLVASGTLSAVGTAEAPIRLTGTTPEPGWWDGIRIEGRVGGPNSRSALHHVTLEYAGYGSHP